MRTIVLLILAVSALYIAATCVPDFKAAIQHHNQQIERVIR